jgi:hypothetical protein
MHRSLAISGIALSILAAAPLLAQSVPSGWKERIDRSTSAADPDATGDVKLITTGTGYHIETPSAAVFWNPANTVSGNYTLKGTFALNKRSGHPNFYGVIFGGSGLEGASQKYTYFMVSQDNPNPPRGEAQPMGSWLAKTRNGDSTAAAFAGLAGANERSGAVAHAAVKVPDAAGKSVNALEVRVQSDKVDFVINGTVVHSAPRASVNTDGIWGIRSNHLLDINVSGLTVTKP